MCWFIPWSLALRQNKMLLFLVEKSVSMPAGFSIPDTFVVLFWYLIVSVWFHKVAVTCLKGFYGVRSNSTWSAEVFTWAQASVLFVPVSTCLGYVLWGRATTSAQCLGLQQGLVSIYRWCFGASCSWARQEGGWTAEAGGQWPRWWPGWKALQLGSSGSCKSITARTQGTRQSCFSQCHSQALPWVPEKSCCHLAWACSSWGKAFVQIKIFLQIFVQELSFNPY